ncbi:MAG: hypothetical protein AAF092_04975 [Pseudomonadota bacterium]
MRPALLLLTFLALTACGTGPEIHRDPGPEVRDADYMAFLNSDALAALVADTRPDTAADDAANAARIAALKARAARLRAASL